MTSPIEEWREEWNMTREHLARACGLTTGEVAKIEEGQTGLPGELQDYLTERGENVSHFASQQSRFVASMGAKE
jgi:DNA-binding transcriptional regulator YiaG